MVANQFLEAGEKGADDEKSAALITFFDFYSFPVLL